MWIYDGDQWIEEGVNETEAKRDRTPASEEMYLPELQVIEIVPVPKTNYVPPGWNRWTAFDGPSYVSAAYYNYLLNVDGTVHSIGHTHGDYSTDLELIGQLKNEQARRASLLAELKDHTENHRC